MSGQERRFVSVRFNRYFDIYICDPDKNIGNRLKAVSLKPCERSDRVGPNMAAQFLRTLGLYNKSWRKYRPEAENLNITTGHVLVQKQQLVRWT